MAIITRAQCADYDKGWSETFGKKATPSTGDVPRRRRMDLMTPAERACLNAISEIEKMGAHPHLTAAQFLIEQAQALVAERRGRAPVNHTCHAHGCPRLVPPKMLACRAHWFALRKDIRDAVWREYIDGQENTKTPTCRYMAVQRLAISTLAFTPFNEEAARVAANYLLEAQRWRIKAIQAGEGDPLRGLVPEEKAA